jgi:nucleotidyltransferase substrate binding protein (TIGR01987 family)
MEKLKSAANAVAAFQAIVAEPFSMIVRDATIQRFEFTFEACWKALKEFLKTQEGLDCSSPKSCFRAAFQAGLIDDATCMALCSMTDSRNLTSHTYIEAIAQKIYEARHEQCRVLAELVKQMQARWR